MLDGPLVFVDVDTQSDFLDLGGSLYIPGSEAIRPNLGRLSRFAAEHEIPVIATACDHIPDDEEFQVFPPHCVSGTPGQARIAETRPADTLVLPVGRVYSGERVPHLTLSKSRYDVFHRHDSADVFRAHDSRGDITFVVYGVATDYCVRCVVDGLLDRGHQVALVVDAIRAVDPEREGDILTELIRRGASLTLTERVCLPT